MIDAFTLSLKVALVATIGAVPLALALAYLFARKEFMGKNILRSLVSLPMVLPPVAVGLLLLNLFSKDGWLSLAPILFTWKAASLAAFIMALPLFVRPAEQAFRSVPQRFEHVALSLGKSRWNVFWSVTFPLSRLGVFYGALLFFLRALGEFGATVLVAGNIPGKTQTLALAIYAHIENFEDEKAWALCALAIGISFFATLFAESFLRVRPNK